MIKIAIAGTSGLAQYIAHYISTQTHHPLILLSRNPNERLATRGWQVVKVDYAQPTALQYTLAGVDTVISTISGDAELGLIDAAAAVGVRRFVPSEFEGPPYLASTAEILDRGNAKSITRLQYYQAKGSMQYTVFVCGVFYERFAPGGLAAFQIGRGTHISAEGSYLLDFRERKAQILLPPDEHGAVWICMTSAQDVAQYVVAALDIPEWPVEFRIYGDRLALPDIITAAETIKGHPFEKTLCTSESLGNSLAGAKLTGNLLQQWRIHHLIATASGCFDFDNPNLQHLVSVRPLRFQDWLQGVWS